jgi:hypothetical protein
MLFDACWRIMLRGCLSVVASTRHAMRRHARVAIFMPSVTQALPAISDRVIDDIGLHPGLRTPRSIVDAALTQVIDGMCTLVGLPAPNVVAATR